MANVIFTAGSGKRSFNLELGGKTVVIGRSEDADLFVNSPRLSRRHCQVAFGERGLELKDLGSSNGTYLNGRRILATNLQNGDVIRLGPVAMQYLEIG